MSLPRCRRGSPLHDVLRSHRLLLGACPSNRKFRNRVVFNDLASAPLQVAINTDYRLRLEATGDRLRVFVNGVKVLEAHDATHRRGRAALITSMAKADYDNVVVSPSPSTTIYADRFYSFNSTDWDETPTGTWLAPVFEDLGGGYSFGLRQTSVAGDARIATGIPEL